MSKIYAFDLDDTLCTREEGVEHLGPDKYKHCHPIPAMIEKLNKRDYIFALNIKSYN